MIFLRFANLSLAFFSFLFVCGFLRANERVFSPKEIIHNICAISFQNTGPLIQSQEPFRLVNKNFLNQLDPLKSLFTKDQVSGFLSQEINQKS